jgi:hypothetical protein
MAVPKEPEITIRGTRLTDGQAMTLRVALENFRMELSSGFGKELGPIAVQYSERAEEVSLLMVSAPQCLSGEQQ